MTTQTIDIAHLGGSTIGYRFAREYDPAKPTLVLINSFSTSADLYEPQFANDELCAVANLLAIEPYGHGKSRAGYADFTYWDSAIANLQVLEALGIPEAFALGTSQGGWITARMALLAPDVIKGIMPLGSSMDYESERSRELGCWDADAVCTPIIDMMSEPVADDWAIPTELVDAVVESGLGENVSDEVRAFWYPRHQATYAGDDGRRNMRLIAINLRDRDGLHGRLADIRCPVMWLQGTADSVYSVKNAEDTITRFVNSSDATLRIIEGGQHFLSASNPDEVNAAATEFVRRHS